MGKSDLHDPDRGWKRLPDGDRRLCEALGGHHHKKKDMVRHLFIYKNQLMYDITAQVGIITNARRSEQGVQANAHEDMLDQYKGMFDRWIDKYVDKVKERLIIAIVDRHQYASGNEMKDWAEKEFLLDMPDWWDDMAWEPLVSSVHDYIVNSVLTEYFKLIYTSKDPITVDKYEDAGNAWDKIKVHLTAHKQGTIRKYLNPMGF